MGDLDLTGLLGLMGGGGNGSSDIASFINQTAKNDIFAQLAPAITGLQFDRSQWKPSESLAVSAGQAFLGSVLGGLAERNQASQLATLSTVLPELYKDPRSVTVPEGLDPSAFGALKISAMRENALEDRKIKEYQVKVFGDVFSKNPAAAVQAFPEIANKLGVAEAASKLTSLDGPEKIPEFVKKEGLEETKTKANLKQTLDFVDKVFDEAKKYTGTPEAVAAANTPFLSNETKQFLSSAGDSLIFQADKLLGRELNTDVRKRKIEAFAPKSFDSDEIRQQKKESLKQYLTSLAQSTPLLDEIDRAEVAKRGGPDLSAYTPAQIEFMKKKGFLK